MSCQPAQTAGPPEAAVHAQGKAKLRQVCELCTSLHLLSCMSPQWLRGLQGTVMGLLQGLCKLLSTLPYAYTVWLAIGAARHMSLVAVNSKAT